MARAASACEAGENCGWRCPFQGGVVSVAPRLLPQTDALPAVSASELLPGQLLPQADAVRAVSAGELLPGQLLPQADAAVPAAAGEVLLLSDCADGKLRLQLPAAAGAGLPGGPPGRNDSSSEST